MLDPTLRRYMPVRLSRRADGKLNKIPLSAATGRAHDATDSTQWVTRAEAEALSAHVGFALTGDDGLFCVDIDEPDLPAEMVAALPGACIERSVSGNGWHLWGRADPLPPHGVVGIRESLQMYSRKRFICLGQQVTDWEPRDLTANVGAFIERFYPPPTGGGRGAEWSSGPCAEWAGHTDDDALIEAALASQGSVRSAFGASATFRQLWEGDAAALGALFPSATGQTFDASGAEQALANHLAFWTGRDCERIERLMLRSGLARDKMSRPGYLGATILNAVASCTDVHKGRPTLPVAPTLVGPGKPAPRPPEPAWPKFARIGELDNLLRGVIYIHDVEGLWLPWRQQVVTQSQANNLLGRVRFETSDSKYAKTAWEGVVRNPEYAVRVVDSVGFDPGREPGELYRYGGRVMLNTWVAPDIEARPGDVTPFIDHLQRLMPGDDEVRIFLSWAASLVQRPARRPNYALCIQGTDGNGKSLLGRILSYCVGEEYTSKPTLKQLRKEFNDYLWRTRLLLLEDAAFSHEDQELVKPIVSETRLNIERKGVSAVLAPIYCGMMVFYNPRNAILKTRQDRRFCVIFTRQQKPEDKIEHGMTDDYFTMLHLWLEGGGFAAVADYLQRYRVEPKFDPCLLAAAPRTASTLDAISESEPVIMQDLREAIIRELPGFRGGMVSTTMARAYLASIGHKISVQGLRRHLDSMGYFMHPALKNGWTNNPVMPDGTKTILYVCDHTSKNMRACDVEKVYSTQNTQNLF